MLFSPEVPLDGHGTVEAVMVRRHGVVMAGITSTGKGTAPLYIQPGYRPLEGVHTKMVDVDTDGNLIIAGPGKFTVMWYGEV